MHNTLIVIKIVELFTTHILIKPVRKSTKRRLLFSDYRYYTLYYFSYNLVIWD